MKNLIIAIQGQKAVDMGYKFQKGNCYRGIYNHGKRIAQLEVVLDSDECYNGIPSKWVDVSGIAFQDVEKVITQLKKIGFSDCPCIIQEEVEPTEKNNYITQVDRCCFII